MGSETLNNGYRNHAWDNLSFLIVLIKLGRGDSKAFLYNLEFLQPCYFTFKISDLFSLSILFDIPMVRGLLVDSWMNAAPLSFPIVRLAINWT